MFRKIKHAGAARLMFGGHGPIGLRGPRVCFAPEDGGGSGGDGGAGAGAAGAGAAGAGAADGGAGAGAAAFDWSGALGGDFDTFKPVIEGDKLADPKAALAAYAGLKTKADGMVALPGADAKPEDWDAVYTKLGRPETPDKYDLSGFEKPKEVPWDETAQTAMIGHLHKLGLNGAQLTGSLNAYKQVLAGQHEARNAFAVKAAEEGGAALQKEWGDKFKPNMDLANRAVKAVFGDTLADAKQVRLEDGRWLLDVPELAKAFHMIGARMAEPGGLPGGLGGASGDGEAMSTEAYLATEVFKSK